MSTEATKMTNQEQEMVHLTINNIPLAVPKGTKIMQAAQKLGIDIPHLCYHEDQRIKARCRLCSVEVAGKQDVFVGDDFVRVHTAGDGFPCRAAEVVRGFLILLPVDDGVHHEHVALLDDRCVVSGEERINDAAVRRRLVGLRAGVDVTSNVVEVNRGVVQPLHSAIDENVDVVMAGFLVLHEIHHVFFGFVYGRNRCRLLHDCVLRLRDSRQILLLDTGCRVFKSLKACEFRGVVCHLIAPLNGLCRLLRGSRPQRGRLRPAWIPCLRWRPCRRG